MTNTPPTKEDSLFPEDMSPGSMSYLTHRERERERERDNIYYVNRVLGQDRR